MGSIEIKYKERPMNSGIIRNTLTTTLALKLEYREPLFWSLF